MKEGPSALLAGAAVLTAGAIGARNGPQRPVEAAWYGLLRKPAYTPPGAVIGAAWGVLELLIAGTGYRLMRAPRSEARYAALGAWGLVLAGLAGYPYLFFSKKRLASSTAASAAMLAAAAGTAIAARDVDRPAAAMTIPLLVWLSFATLLSEEIWRKNRVLSRD